MNYIKISVWQLFCIALQNIIIINNVFNDILLILTKGIIIIDIQV